MPRRLGHPGPRDNLKVARVATPDSALAVAEVQQQASMLDTAIRATQARMARKSFSHFCEFVLKGPARKALRLAPVHNCWIEHIIGNYHPNARIGVLAPWHHGKCLSGMSLIQMADGSLSPIANVRPGQWIVSIDEATLLPLHQRVVATSSSGRQDLIRVTFVSGRFLECTPSHPLLSVGGWALVSSLEIGDMVASMNSARWRSDGVFWDSVVSVGQIEPDETYDLQIDGYPNFLANGIYVHNSTIAAIGFPLFLIGRRPSTRVAIISNTDDEASKRVQAIAEYIERDEDYATVFPWVKPDAKGPWSGHQLKVRRRVISIEPTIEGTGIDGAVMGSHYDLMVFDDPIDQKDADSPAIREGRKAKFFQTFMSRPAPGGVVLIISTRWCTGDLIGELVENEEYGFRFLVQAVSEDYKHIEQPPAHYRPFPSVSTSLPSTIPLWEPYWGEDELRQRERSVTRRGFARGFRQVPFSDEDFVFSRADIDAVCDWEHPPEAVVDSSWPKFCGVDLAGEKRPGTVIFTFAVAPGGKKYLWEVRRGAWGFGTRAAEQIIAAYERNRPELIVVENNVSQVALLDILKLVGAPWLPITGYCTGREKADLTKGVPGLQVQIENRGWVFALGHIASHRGKSCDCPYCVFLAELRQYPHGTTDTTMAMWLAERGFASGQVYDVDATELDGGSGHGRRVFDGRGPRIFQVTERRIF